MLQIPAIEWDEKIVSGSSSVGSDTITGIADTSQVSSGMIVSDSAFPYPSLVVSKTANTITLSQNATANKTGSFSFYKRFEFRYPANKDKGEQLRANQTRTLSLSGIPQTLTNFIEARRDLSFTFLTLSEKTTLQNDFYSSWALLGKAFRYYNDKEIDSKVTYQNDSNEFKQDRVVKKHPDYLYELDFRFRRVI